MSSKDAIVNIDGSASLYSQKEKPRVVIAETEVPGTQPVSEDSIRRIHPVHRSVTTGTFSGHEGPTLTQFGQRVYKLLENPIVRYCIYIIPVASLLAIPLILFATKYRDHTADGIHLLGLFIWIEVIWVSLWIAKLIASALPYIFQGVCGLISTGVRKYALVLRAVEIQLSLLFWTILTFVELPIIWSLDKPVYNARFDLKTNNLEWLHILSNVCKASICCAAVYLAEKTMIQLISVSYHGKQHKDTIKDIKLTTHAVDLLYGASLKRFYDHHPDFLEEDYDIHDTTNVQKLLREYAADRSTMRVFGDIHFYGERLVSLFGRMASDITGTEVFSPTATHSLVESALERKAGAEALARRIYKSLVPQGSNAITEADIVDELGEGKEFEAAFIFKQLDRDRNGDVSLEEMIALVTGIARTRKDMWKSVCDIKSALKVLDHVLSAIVLVIIIMIYSAWFSSTFADNWQKIWTVLSAGAFSFGSTVGEFNAACILVFIKHPFDVGDRVNINDIHYEVNRISLLYTVFRRVDNDTIVQVANSVIGNLWVDNISRSKAMKEKLIFSVSPGTSFQDIETLRAELEAFARAPENSRDFQPDVDIQLHSVGDLKQLDLIVEIKHKSNWSNDKLRAYRRSKFMCALLSAMRKVPIDGPAGSGPMQGTINSPNYSVNISEAEARESRAHFDQEKAAKRLLPVGQSYPGYEAAISTGLDILPSHQVPPTIDEVLPFRRPAAPQNHI